MMELSRENARDLFAQALKDVRLLEDNCRNADDRKIGERLNSRIIALSRHFLAEMDKDKVWADAPEWSVEANIQFKSPTRAEYTSKTYTRELPKTKAREIAERVGKEFAGCMDAYTQESEQFADIIEAAINEALGGKGECKRDEVEARR